MKSIVTLAAVAALASITESAGSLRGRSGPPAGRQLDSVWQCTDATQYPSVFDDNDGDKKVSVGDTVRSTAPGVQLKAGGSTVVPIYKGFAIFAVNVTAPGLTVTSIINVSDVQASTLSAATPPITCPAGQVATTSADSAGVRQSAASTPVNSCDSYGDYENSNSLCYASCRQGYTGNGPLCVQDCPSGFDQTDLSCTKPSSYGNGVGNALTTSCSGGGCSGGDCSWSGCNPISCEPISCGTYCKNGQVNVDGLCFDPCRDGFHFVGGSVCSPDCPSGFDDFGVGCTRPSYGRGVGKVLGCANGYSQDNSAGICCPTDTPYAVGATCYKDKGQADALIAEISATVAVVALTVVVGALTFGAGAAALAPEDAALLSADVAAGTTVTAEGVVAAGATDGIIVEGSGGFLATLSGDWEESFFLAAPGAAP
jgi:hypothetical protein